MPASSYIGHLAALGTASCWACSALAFDVAARRMGALALNLIRLVMALGFLTLLAWTLRGLPLPVDVTPHAWGWLAVSGLLGFTFGDFCLFQAFVKMGPRLSMLMMALAPPLAAVIGWLVLGETLDGRDLLGMVLTVSGIGWAVLERRETSSGSAALQRRASLSGVALGFGAALGQAGGLVLSKVGMGSHHAVAATQVRVIAGIAGYALVFLALRGRLQVGEALRDRRALAFAALGAFFGPCVGVTLSLVAVRHTTAGVAASLMALTPVILIPLVILLKRERVGLGGVLGALVAVAGVALLMM